MQCAESLCSYIDLAIKDPYQADLSVDISTRDLPHIKAVVEEWRSQVESRTFPPRGSRSTLALMKGLADQWSPKAWQSKLGKDIIELADLYRRL